MGGRTSLTVYPGMTGMTENAFINIKNRSFTITAPVDAARCQDQRRDHRPGRRLRRLGLVHERRKAPSRLQLLRRRPHQHRRRPTPLPAGKHDDQIRVQIRRPQTRLRRQRARSSSTAKSRHRPRPQNATLRPSPPTKAPTSASTTRPPSPRTTSRRQQVHRPDRKRHDRREAFIEECAGQESRGGCERRGGDHRGLGRSLRPGALPGLRVRVPSAPPSSGIPRRFPFPATTSVQLRARSDSPGRNPGAAQVEPATSF